MLLPLKKPIKGNIICKRQSHRPILVVTPQRIHDRHGWIPFHYWQNTCWLVGQSPMNPEASWDEFRTGLLVPQPVQNSIVSPPVFDYQPNSPHQYSYVDLSRGSREVWSPCSWNTLSGHPFKSGTTPSHHFLNGKHVRWIEELLEIFLPPSVIPSTMFRVDQQFTTCTVNTVKTVLAEHCFPLHDNTELHPGLSFCIRDSQAIAFGRSKGQHGPTRLSFIPSLMSNVHQGVQEFSAWLAPETLHPQLQTATMPD